MDAAKGMWLFYEHPDATFDGMKLKFMDIRKRAYKFPRLGAKAQMVCIPTTSGTGSEVTSFSVVTDRKNGNVKYPLADYSLTPNVSIIDPQFVMSLPKGPTADTGLDVLTLSLIHIFNISIAASMLPSASVKAFLPVSYTHLDVYKRQVPTVLSRYHPGQLAAIPDLYHSPQKPVEPGGNRAAP